MNTKKLVLSAMFIALGLLLPFLTGQVPEIGNKLLPMHIPVLISGFVLGGPYGLIIGLIVPLLRSVTFGMPPLYPVALAMSFELAAYGFFAGFFYKLLPKKSVFIFVTLILAMLLGRVVWGAVMLLIMGLGNMPFSRAFFINAAVINAVPGIVLQIVLIPIIILALKRARLIVNG